jgi:hypothetical protein
VARSLSYPGAYGETGLLLLAFTVSSVLVFVSAEIIHGPEWALLAYCLWVCCPWVIYLASKPLSDLPFCCFLFAIFYILCRAVQVHDLSPTKASFLGLLVGFSMLVRPIGLFLGLMAVAFVWLLADLKGLRRRVVVALMIIVGAAIPVVPWELFVYATNHQVILLSTGSTPSIRDGLVFASNSHLKTYRHKIVAPVKAQQVSLDTLRVYPALNSNGAIVHFLLSETHHNPVGILELYVLKAARSWYGSDAQQQDSWVLGVQLILLPLVLVGASGTWNLGGYYRRYAVMGLVLTLYFWIMTTLVLSILRYMVPVMGLLFVLTPGWRAYLNYKSKAGTCDSVSSTNAASRPSLVPVHGSREVI